jgi:tRNA (cytidine32/uridine32-2'-O)-methyltransferase
MIRFVLVETSHPGNIGAAARALKTMEQANWVLVSPSQFPHPEALAMASGATDWLDSVQVVATLEEAVADCEWVVATSARPRSAYYWPELSPEEATEQLVARSQQGATVAVVFGPERTGLSNEHLDFCQALIAIPANPAYSSLNLAQAVQIIAYEIHKRSAKPATAPVRRLAMESELRRLEEHVLSVSARLGFKDQSGHLLTRVRRIVHRIGLEPEEVNILRGILASMEPVLSASKDGHGD